jgi:GTP-binding protein EngB required for normal cell division
LENCSKVLENFCNEDYAISGKSNVARSTLIDALVQRYKEAFQDFFQEVKYPLLYI